MGFGGAWSLGVWGFRGYDFEVEGFGFRGLGGFGLMVQGFWWLVVVWSPRRGPRRIQC